MRNLQPLWSLWSPIAMCQISALPGLVIHLESSQASRSEANGVPGSFIRPSPPFRILHSGIVTFNLWSWWSCWGRQLQPLFFTFLDELADALYRRDMR